jgi:hypothetical protein
LGKDNKGIPPPYWGETLLSFGRWKLSIGALSSSTLSKSVKLLPPLRLMDTGVDEDPFVGDIGCPLSNRKGRSLIEASGKAEATEAEAVADAIVEAEAVEAEAEAEAEVICGEGLINDDCFRLLAVMLLLLRSLDDTGIPPATAVFARRFVTGVSSFDFGR